MLLSLIRFPKILTWFFLLEACCLGYLCKANGEPPIKIEIDARDLPRKLLHAKLEIPVAVHASAQTVSLWYPKWIPGSHGPSGPIANIGGLRVEDAQGNALPWFRSPGEVYRIEVRVPANTSQLRLWVRYITNQPTTISTEHDSWGSPKIGFVSPNTILFYPESCDPSRQQIEATILLPKAWEAATSLLASNKQPSSDAVTYQPVSLNEFVDSPIMCGRYREVFDLVEEDQPKIPPHRMHLFRDEPPASPLDPALLDRYRKMVTQTSLMMGSHPFDRFEVLLGITDSLPANGLEHSKSSFNILPTASFQSPETLKGWNRLLIPHEYLHAWCGKYRRPSAMITKSFHYPENTELLWVYEGLTQYLGELIEARSGLMTADEFQDRLLVELRNAIHCQGRQWRTLADTASAAHILRDSSPYWSGLRRSQDFYMEGMLFWLEVDARLRSLSQHTKSLDDFCQAFFKCTDTSPHPNPYNRDELVRTLNDIAPFDWDGLIRRRIESFQESFDPSMVELLGYRLELNTTTTILPAETFGKPSGIDTYDSLGILFDEEGTITNLLLGSPADRARLMPGMKVTAIGNYTWSSKRLEEAIEQSTTEPVVLKILDGDEIRSFPIEYREGKRHWNLIRQHEEEDMLEQILTPRGAT